MIHKLCDTSFIDDEISKYEDLKDTYRDTIDDLAFLDQPAFDTPFLDSFMRFSVDSVTAMRLSQIESQRDALKRRRQSEISRAESKIHNIETRISALKLIKKRYDTFIVLELMPAIEDKIESEKKVIADCANLRLRLARRSDEYEPPFLDFDLPEELDKEFESICSGYSKFSYWSNWKNLL